MKLNFKIYDVINRETNNFNTHITQYLKQSENKIWLVNRI